MSNATKTILALAAVGAAGLLIYRATKKTAPAPTPRFKPAPGTFAKLIQARTLKP